MNAAEGKMGFVEASIFLKEQGEGTILPASEKQVVLALYTKATVLEENKIVVISGTLTVEAIADKWWWCPF